MIAAMAAPWLAALSATAVDGSAGCTVAWTSNLSIY